MATLLSNQVSAYHDSVMHASRMAAECWDMHQPAQEAILTAPGLVTSISAVLSHLRNNPDTCHERMELCQSMLDSMTQVMRDATVLRDHQFELVGMREFDEAMTQLRLLMTGADGPTTGQQTDKYRSPAAALDPWEHTDEGIAVLRQIMDPANPIGKAIDHGTPVARADASVIRRRHS
jgi:hypothetical protein